MSTRTCSKSRLLLAIGLLVTLLAGLGAPAVAPATVSAETLDNHGALPFATARGQAAVPLDEKLRQFEQYLADMQRELAIPGMSAAIVKDQSVIWAQGFGYADVEAQRPATADTPYEIASLTKPVSSAVLLRLVEQGRVNLEDPVSRYGVYIKSPGVIRVKHLLGMTSQGEPGSIFRYSGNRYAYLQKVIERASGRPFPALLIETVLDPLGMSDSIPITMLGQPAYAHIRDRLSKPVTAWGVMRLVESGQLELDAPVEQYLTRWHLPPSRYDAAGVTIRRLLSHTAGLSLHGYPGLPPDQALPTLEESLSGKNGGANAGWRAYFVAIPEQGLGVVVLTNSDNGMALIDNVVSVCGEQLLP